MPNKPIHFLSFFVLSFFGIVSCDNNNSMNSTAVPEINIEFLYQTWLSSYEEGTDTFRPASYDFPPSRGRTGFTFLEDRLYGSLYGSDDEDGIYIVYQIWTIVTIGIRKKNQDLFFRDQPPSPKLSY